MKNNHSGTIKEIKQINENVYSVKIFSPAINHIEPGQYISILCDNLTLRRPFSVSDFEDNVITVLIKRRGKGSEYITSLNVGNIVEFSAPLGNGFKFDNKRTLLIGAGIGVAPLFYLRKKLKQIGSQTFLAAGFLNINEVINASELDFFSTDDGSNLNIGSICDYLEKLIAEFKPERIVSCAPHPVLKYVAQVAKKYAIDCDVCMEKVMACGIGVCRGCVIKINESNEVVNKTVCKDGPVFSGEAVVW